MSHGPSLCANLNLLLRSLRIHPPKPSLSQPASSFQSIIVARHSHHPIYLLRLIPLPNLLPIHSHILLHRIAIRTTIPRQQPGPLLRLLRLRRREVKRHIHLLLSQLSHSTSKLPGLLSIPRCRVSRAIELFLAVVEVGAASLLRLLFLVGREALRLFFLLRGDVGCLVDDVVGGLL